MSVILIYTATVVVWKRQLQKKGNKISRVVAIFVSNFEFKDMSDRNCARRRQPKTMLNFF